MGEKIRDMARSRPAPHNEENFMDCIVKDLNYGGIDVEFEQGYKKGDYAMALERKERSEGVKESFGKMSGRRSYREEPMKMNKTTRKDRDAY